MPAPTPTAAPSIQTEPPAPTPTSSRQEYDATLLRLSEASVRRHFDAFVDVPWDHPDFQVDRTDERWILPAAVDPLGAHPWYQSLPVETRIEIGMWRQANIMKVGLQFENLLIRGIMQYIATLDNGSAEFRYLTHEATEECHHTQMFQQGVNIIGADVPGLPRWLRRVSPVIPWFASLTPVGFFIGVLAGEEPIDHTQKQILRGADELPPVLSRIMEIHVAEEARHISFAHTYVARYAPRLSRGQSFAISLAFPVIMRVLCDAILKPTKEFREEFGVPREVIDELYWDSPKSREFLSDLFSDVRMLAEQSGLMNPLARRVWRALKIDGRASRYRSEPPVTYATGA
ncbi:membrane protein [Dietzia sp. UCD-THP]|uniref:AurF N-oxygenase family protein n=1 Tax=Dietzia sp. UCD-THP TaxID=1292020 RepID=UPI0003813B0D|nr:diiron oxygenase [Dietzia sp. UCD-THP]EYT57246.1 membrane protein [Dietzia sp. UCD-THP]MDZ4235327.1 diiron oxygenase [Dietzia sp.]